jgi:cytochrome b6-f complex iron-sulfur subunit
LAVAGGGVGLYFAFPRSQPGEFGGVFDLGPVSELPAPGDPPVNHPHGRFWLVHTAGGLIALYKSCTHLDCMFNWNEQEQTFICPCHGSRFDRQGNLMTGPAPRSLDRFVVELVASEGQVIAQTDAGSGAPLALPAALKPEPASASPEEGPQADPLAGMRIRVDTGRKITGARVQV